MASQTPFEAEATRIMDGFTSAKTVFDHPHGRLKFLEFLQSRYVQHTGLMLTYIFNLATKFGSGKVLGREPLEAGDEDLIFEFNRLHSLLGKENFSASLSDAVCASYKATLED